MALSRLWSYLTHCYTFENVNVDSSVRTKVKLAAPQGPVYFSLYKYTILYYYITAV